MPAEEEMEDGIKTKKTLHKWLCSKSICRIAHPIFTQMYQKQFLKSISQQEITLKLSLYDWASWDRSFERITVSHVL